ncbi:urease accessory protein UreD [Massilia forsythiae]|uniref:Urease accessory protein UreD n=1 Tax=Massilia forsythiae TaxID=2728020 RepID=A0A7Z2ZUW2_9BURK|nr:urease accessory protein UreD [Massilia forsythiae]QJE02710.1 urease accessory protein UreD [Massilia forsythiae]
MRDFPDSTPSHDAGAWHASLRLRFDDDGGTTRLSGRAHRGPLRVQKALYPEGPRTCHVIVVHPPGGVVGGDRLDLALDAGAAAEVLATTPGAAKWYRANGRVSRQNVVLTAGPGAAIEWLPQETIFYDDADVVLEHEVDLAPGARYIGSEILCFGRRACGETFRSGRVRQRTRIRQGGRLVWWEQGTLYGGDAMRSPLGLGGRSVCATLVAVGAPLPAALLADLRAGDPALGLSQVKSVFVARHLGDDGEAARASLQRVWQALRPHLLGRPACVPRIWHT